MLLFVCFVALRPKSTAMVIAGRSVHLTTPFSWASLNKQLTSNRVHTFAWNWQQPFMNDSAEGRRMTVEIISWSISTKVWDRAGIELATPGSAVSFASVTRHVTDCATRLISNILIYSTVISLDQRLPKDLGGFVHYGLQQTLYIIHKIYASSSADTLQYQSLQRYIKI